MGKLTGQVAIVTGASRGIGHFITRELAKEGASILVAARTEEVSDPRLPGTIHSVVEEAKSLGGNAVAYRLDVTKDEEIAGLVPAALEAFGKVDLVVNNAALLFPGPFMDLPLRRLDLSYRVNIRGPYAITQAVLPHMLERGSGTVITISSGAADTASPNNISYAMTKSAIEKMMQGLAAELGGRGLRFYGLKPQKLVVTPGAMYNALTIPEDTEPEEHMGLATIWLHTARRAAAFNGRSFASTKLLESHGEEP
jgi:NAD(P)-dependent dehydrogenase (short-subunit alcohol dehydrogenase family)